MKKLFWIDGPYCSFTKTKTKIKTKAFIRSCMFWNKPLTDEPMIVCKIILRAWFIRHRHYLEQKKTFELGFVFVFVLAREQAMETATSFLQETLEALTGLSTLVHMFLFIWTLSRSGLRIKLSWIVSITYGWSWGNLFKCSSMLPTSSTTCFQGSSQLPAKSFRISLCCHKAY